jgi:putative flippase GtrA
MTAVGEPIRIARFLVVGLLNTCVGLAVIYACKYLGQLNDILANAIGYAVALVNSFAWNRNWTFAYSGTVIPAAARFLAVFLVAYVANLLTATIAIETFGVNSYLAHAVAIAPYTALFYLGSRYLVFAR